MKTSKYLLCVRWFFISAFLILEQQVTALRHSSILSKLPKTEKLELNDHQSRKAITFTVTNTETKTVTTTKTEASMCFKLVNVSSSCRRQRGHWMEEPIVISFDEVDDDKLIDILYTPVLGIEETAASMQNTNIPELEVNRQSYHDIPHLDGSIRIFDDDDDPEYPRISHREVFDLMTSFFPINIQPSIIVITTTKKKTVTFIRTLRTTYTYFLQRCTPSPFLFKECPKRQASSSFGLMNLNRPNT